MSVISLKLKNISARIPPPLFSPFFSKEDIKQLLLKKFFHYNVSHDAILATRSYKIDSFSIVNFPLIIDPRFVFSFHSRYRYKFASPKILQTRKSTIIADTNSKSLPQLVQLNAKWTKPLNASTPRLNCGGSKERERENSSTWSLRPKFSFHVRFWPIVAAMHLPNVSPPPPQRLSSTNIWHSVGKLVPGHAQ